MERTFEFEARLLNFCSAWLYIYIYTHIRGVFTSSAVLVRSVEMRACKVFIFLFFFCRLFSSFLFQRSVLLRDMTVRISGGARGSVKRFGGDVFVKTFYVGLLENKILLFRRKLSLLNGCC